MLLCCDHASGGCGLPGVEEITEKKCEKLAKRIAGNLSLVEGAELGQGHNGHFQNVKIW